VISAILEISQFLISEAVGGFVAESACREGSGSPQSVINGLSSKFVGEFMCAAPLLRLKPDSRVLRSVYNARSSGDLDFRIRRELLNPAEIVLQDHQLAALLDLAEIGEFI
jgi:hypothetical protein